MKPLFESSVLPLKSQKAIVSLSAESFSGINESLVYFAVFEILIESMRPLKYAASDPKPPNPDSSVSPVEPIRRGSVDVAIEGV